MLDIQSDLLDELKTTVIIPLSPKSIAGKASISKLCPTIDIDNKEYSVLTPQMAGIERKILGKEIGDLVHYRTELISAVDFILSGI